MATEALSYQGINRAYSDYAGAKFCEELIDLRPTTEGLVPVKDFTAKATDVAWRRIFVHHSTDGDHYFVVKKNSGSVSVHLLDADMDPITPALFSIITTSDAMQGRVVDGISFAAAGNIVLFSVCDPTDSVLENHAFVWKGSSYDTMEADIPNIVFGVDDGTAAVSADVSIRQIDSDIPSEVIQEQETAINAIQEENPDLCVGPILIATAFKTTDGQTFWTKSWKIYDPSAKVDALGYPPYVDENTTWEGSTRNPERDWAAYFQKYGHAYETFHADSGDLYFRMYGTKVKLTFSQLGTWNEETSILQSVEVYASKPVPYLDTTAAYDAFWKPFGFVWCLPKREYKDMELGGQMLYHQASIPLASLKRSSQEVSLTFGGNQQVTEDVLDVDAGQLTRYGKLLSYNARFHFWNSVSSQTIGGVTLAQENSGNQASWKVVVRYEDAQGNGGLYLVGTPSYYNTPAYLVVAPSLNIKEVVLYSATLNKIQKYRMTASTTYNYSYCDTGPYYNGTPASADVSLYGSVTGNVVQTEEKAAINVTEQYNPFVFRVEHSYLAPGVVLDVKPQMAGIVDSSYGRDPLNVFTVRGVYALTQGSANVLYGAFLPLSDLVLSGPSVPTEQGIFFLADGALWLVRGRTATLISDALHLGPHKFIRKCPGYQKIAGVDEVYDPGSTVTNPVYDVSDALSQVTFETFVRTGGTLSFNRFRMEIFVSNPAYEYSYVLSLKYRQWHKVSRCLWQDQPGATVISTHGTVAGAITVLDLSLEEDSVKNVHYQTRPFSMGYAYSHLHRIVAMVRAELENSSQNLTAALYGSDNLQDWNLLAYANRSGTTTTENNVTTSTPLKLSQLRTTSAARSWRYYAVTVGGTVNTEKDIDLGPVIVDYEPVIRRIG